MKIKRIVILFLIPALLLPLWAIYSINEQIRPQVASISMVEANNAASKVVQKAISALALDTSDLISCQFDEKGQVISLTYNTEKLNQILNTGLDAATESLTAAAMGIKDPNTDVLYYDKGIIYSIHLGYFTGLAIFADLGPKINVRLKVMHACSGQIQVTTTPYGVNSTLIQIDLLILTDMVVITPFLMNTVPMECRIPLVIQLVQGEVPQMMLKKIA